MKSHNCGDVKYFILPNTTMWIQPRTCLEPFLEVKKASQFFQRHFRVWKFGLVWSVSKCCFRWSTTPKISEHPCHWLKKHTRISQERRILANAFLATSQYSTKTVYTHAISCNFLIFLFHFHSLLKWIVSIPLITALERFFLPLAKPRPSAKMAGGRQELNLYMI